MMRGAPTASTRETWRRALVVLVLGVVALTLTRRAETLVVEGFVPSSHGEARWLAWATGPEGLRDGLIAELLRLDEPPSARLQLVVEPPPGPGLRPEHIDVVARYLYPVADVAGPAVGSREARVVRFTADEGSPWPPVQATPQVGFAFGLLVTLVVGAGLLPRRPVGLEWCLAWTVGWSVWVVLGGLIASLGFAVDTAAAVSLWVVGCGLVVLRRALSPTADPPERSQAGADERLSAWSWSLAGLGLGLVAWKARAAPLWSWDHWAIWGFKSRLLLTDEPLAGLAERQIAAPHYPLGLPAAWNVVLAGAPLSPFQVKVLHALMAVLLVGLVGLAVRRLGGSENAVRASLAASVVLPLLWSTEGLGLAELPLALTLLGAISVVAVPSSAAGWSLVPVLVAPALLKDDGLPLALLLLSAALVRSRRNAPSFRAAGLGVALVALARWVHPLEGTSFLGGAWRARLAERLSDPAAVLEPALHELLRPEAFGLWLLLPLLLGVASVRRQRAALACAALVTVQLGAYLAVYFATYLDPEAHIVSSFARIASALEPLLLVSWAVALAPASETVPEPLID